MNDIKLIAISTGGGDAPGLNTVIHAAVCAALQEKPEGATNRRKAA